MFQLAYISKVKKDLSQEKIVDICNAAAIKNENDKIDITSFLILHNHVFFQYLEGSEQAVRALYERIANDSRHEDCTLVYTHQATARQFPHWYMRYLSMGYIEEIAPKAVVQDFKDIMMGNIENKQDISRIVNSLTSVISSRS